MDYKNKTWLEAQYVENRLSASQIGKLCGRCTRTILNWLERFGIPRRPANEKPKGKTSPLWGHKRSEETRRKMSANHARRDMSGSNNPMFGRTGKRAPNYGKEQTKEKKDKISKALKGRKRPHMCGDKNPAWKGGKTPLIVNLRNSPQMDDWRNQIFAKDHYCCTKCGDGTGHNLNAHHIKHLAVLIREHDIATLDSAYACVAIWNLDNGVTLCEVCHNELHKGPRSVPKLGNQMSNQPDTSSTY